MTRKPLKEQRRQRLVAENMRRTGQLPGVAPASLRTMLETECRRPLAGGDRPLDHGSLWGDSHRQTTLF